MRGGILHAFLSGTLRRLSLRPVRVIQIAPFNGTRPLARMLLAALVAVGFSLQGLLPGLDLALRGETPSVGFGVKAAICHASSVETSANAAGVPAAGDEGQSDSHGCCLVCQAASLSKGALPSPTFTLPTAGTASLRIAQAASTHVDGQASHHHLPRGPPLA